jgi:hypothetical protein
LPAGDEANQRSTGRILFMATTPFDLEIRFTGICAFVPNLDPTGTYSLCVVMPGDDHDRDAIDGERLHKHEAFVRFFAAEPPPPPFPGPAPLKEYPLKNCRVALQVGSGSGRPVLPGGFSPYLLDLPDLIGSYAEIDPAIVNSNPPDPPVVVQVLLGVGTISYLPDSTARWTIAKLDNGNTRSNVELVHEVVLKVTAVTSASLHGASFDGATPIDIDLNPATVPGSAFVRIENVCNGGATQTDNDRDFKWYHELLVYPQRQAIATELRRDNKDLPIPRVVGVGGGQDCFGAKLPGVTFGT